jgi:hypothetical protein
MGLNFNNSVDQPGPPNQASVGANYVQLADGPNAPPTPGNTTIHRRGVVTYLLLTGALTASRVAQFGTQAAEGWLPGDVVFIALPSHAGVGFTFTVQNIHGDVLATWVALLANGGTFIFGPSGFALPAGGTGDFSAIPGASTT